MVVSGLYKNSYRLSLRYIAASKLASWLRLLK